MNPTKLIRSAASTGLSLTAKGLSLAAKVAGAVARVASRSDSREQPSEREAAVVTTPDRGAAQATTADVEDAPQERVEPDSDEAEDRRGRVMEPAVETVPDAPRRVRTHETHAAELAAKPAAEVIKAVAELSTDELRQLLEEEQGGKQRKTVIAAIERALTEDLDISSDDEDRTGRGQGDGRGSEGSKDSPSPEPASEAGGVPTGGATGGPAQRARV